MKFGPHKLKGNKTSAWPQRVVFVDTETTPQEKTTDSEHHVLKLGYLQYVSFHKKKLNDDVTEDLEFYDKKTACDFILSKAPKGRRLIVMASNVWFDLSVLGMVKYLGEKGFKSKRFYQAGLTTIFQFTKDKQNIIFISIQNFLKFSIGQLGQMLGSEKLSVDFDQATDEELMVYCRQDTDILRKSYLYWKRICLKHDFGVFGITLPSQCFNAFRHRFMHHNIYIHDNEEAIQLERDSYFGGRTECFYLGKITGKTVHKLDINSLYPAVMADREYPTGLRYICRSPCLKLADKILEEHCAVADVTVKITKPYVPHPIGGRTCFPIGEFKTSVNTETLRRLIRENAVKKIHKMAVYYKAPIFDQYIAYLSEQKEKADKDNDQFKRKTFKLFLNSLYGKFGQKKREVVYEYETDPEFTRNEQVYHAEDQQSYHVVAFGGKEVWYSHTENNSVNAFVAIAAHVTDYARLVLWDTIQRLPDRHYYYCDTDSLFVTDKALEILKPVIHPTKMGLWKHEDETEYLEIRNPKDYTFGQETKRKGIRHNAEDLGNNTYRQVWFPGFKTAIKHDLQDGFHIRYVTKTLKSSYSKAQVASDGWTYPFVL